MIKGAGEKNKQLSLVHNVESGSLRRSISQNLFRIKNGW